MLPLWGPGSTRQVTIGNDAQAPSSRLISLDPGKPWYMSARYYKYFETF